MANWRKTGYEIHTDGRKLIVYESPQVPGVRIESRRINIPHANGIGYWQKTYYYVIQDDKEKEFERFSDAKEAAERLHQTG